MCVCACVFVKRVCVSFCETDCCFDFNQHLDVIALSPHPSPPLEEYCGRQIGLEKVRHMKLRMTEQDEVERNREELQIKGCRKQSDV